MILSKDGRIILGIFLGTILVLVQGLNFHGVEFRDDEVFYFKSTQEMIASGNIFSPTFLGENRFQKPILFYWMILASFKTFGVSWFAARLASVLCAALTVVLTWCLARDLFNRTTATLSAFLLLTSSLFFRHAKGAVPDMVMNFFIVLAVYSAFKFIQNPMQRKYSWGFFVACGLGFMVKGFAAVVVPFLAVIIYAYLIRRSDILRKINFSAGLLILAVIILPWFLYMINRHGAVYTNYMLVEETKNRLISPVPVNFFIKFSTTLINNSCFYVRNLIIFFAPWSVLLIGAIPLAVLNMTQNEENKKSWGLPAVWFFVVFAFFTCTYITINHYLLILSTPFAILVSAYLLDLNSRSAVTQWLVKGFLIFLMGATLLGLIFLQVFLVSAPGIWVLFYISAFAVYCWLIRRDRSPVIAPLLVAIAITGIFSVQTVFMRKAGLNSHSVWERMAKIIQDDCRGNCAIAIGSRDIHEKEVQVYFDQKLEKIGSDYDALTDTLTKQFVYREEPQRYSIITLQDYTMYPELYDKIGFKRIAEDFVTRKRFFLDQRFFYAMVTLNRPTVLDYLKEKVILLRRDVNDDHSP